MKEKVRLRLVDIQGFGGPYKKLLPNNGEFVKLVSPGHHGDWKTVSVRPGDWPTIPAGTEVEVIGWMQNMYGVFLKVKYKNWEYDIPTSDFEGL